MQVSIRQALVKSHAAAIAIVVFLFWTMDSGFRALWAPYWRVQDFIGTAIAVRGLPYFSFDLTVGDRMMLFTACFYFIEAITSFVTALVLARWFYRTGLLEALQNASKSIRRHNA